MKKIIIILMIIFACAVKMDAQVRVGGSSAPNASAILDLNPDETDNTQMGLLLPRVPLISTTDASPMISHVKGMFIFNTATVNDVTPGIYYNNGTRWINLSDNNADDETHNLTINIGHQLDVTSLTVKGKFSTIIPLENIVSIRPVFSQNDFLMKYLNVTTSFTTDSDGNIDWIVNITNKNIDYTQTVDLNEILITYKGNIPLFSTMPELYSYVGW